MKIISLFIIVCLLIFYSCSENSTEGNVDSNILIPFKVGNNWEYKNIYYDTLGNVIDTHNTVEQIIKDTVIFNLLFYKYDNSPAHLTYKKDGIWFYEIVDSVIEEQSLYLKYPCKTGDTYRFSIGRPPSDVSIISTAQNVQVEAGTFSCILYHFKHDSINGYNNLYVAPGIGTIKYEHFYGRQSSTIYKTSESTLIRYQLY
jgi:hypothetical protein